MKYLLTLTMALCFMAFSSNNAIGQTQTANSETIEANAETTLTVKVKGVGCATDIKMIRDNVEKLDGVSKCEVVKKGATTSFNVTYVPELVKEESIHAAVEDTPGCENPNDRPYKVKI